MGWNQRSTPTSRTLLLKAAEAVEEDERGKDLQDQRRKLEDKHGVVTLGAGADARGSFLAYLDALSTQSRTHVKQDETGTSAEASTRRRGAGRAAGGAQPKTPAPKAPAPPTTAPVAHPAATIPGLPRSVRVEDTELWVEGLPGHLTESHKMRNMEQRVQAFAALAAKPPRSATLCREFDKEEGCPYGNGCRFWHAKQAIEANTNRCNCGAHGEQHGTYGPTVPALEAANNIWQTLSEFPGDSDVWKTIC